jgi:hypothetical protein
MGDPHLPLAVFGDLSKPANTLIEKISEAIGGAARPYQIIRVARAEGQAEIIRTTARMEAQGIERRALERFASEEIKKQQNMEEIIRKALPEVREEAKPENLEPDWISNFFDKSRLTSDEDMQKLWAKILAGEANQPGKFSRGTVNLVGTLDRGDALLFKQLCRFAFTLETPYPLVYDLDAKIYMNEGINYGVLAHLDSIGLINFDNAGGYRRLNLSQEGLVYYFGREVYVAFPGAKSPCSLRVGKVLLTRAGRQLAEICDAQPVEGFIEYVQEMWRGYGYKTEPDPEPAAPAAPEQNQPQN